MTTLRDALNQIDASEAWDTTFLNDGGTNWIAYNLLDALDGDSLDAQVVYDAERGTITGYDSAGFLGRVLYRVEVANDAA